MLKGQKRNTTYAGSNGSKAAREASRDETGEVVFEPHMHAWCDCHCDIATRSPCFRCICRFGYRAEKRSAEAGPFRSLLASCGRRSSGGLDATLNEITLSDGKADASRYIPWYNLSDGVPRDVPVSIQVFEDVCATCRGEQKG